MILNISKNNSNVIERGVYYFGLSDYPHITISDLKRAAASVKYEKLYGRHIGLWKKRRRTFISKTRQPLE